MNLQARTAIEALRAGVPNRAAVRLMGIADPAIEQAFDDVLHAVWAHGDGARPGIGLAGGFGAGKSHALGYLAEVARTHRFVVSRVVISKETPLSDPARLFEAAVRGAALPGRNDDPVAGTLALLREAPERLKQLEQAVADPASGFAPVFAAILFLLRRPATPPEAIRRCERFLGGARYTSAAFRQLLAGAGAARAFDLRLPPAAELVQQRIQFLPRLFEAAGFAGWCLLLDEVELIGRYTPLQRALAYAWLATWLGLDGAGRFPGIVTAYAITDDFPAAVVEQREDAERLPERLRLKGRELEARLALAAIRHVEATVARHRLRPPGDEELAHAMLRVRGLYETAYGWPPPALPPPERTASRTIRQHIKAWITQWDMRRLAEPDAAIVAGSIGTNYEEDEQFAASGPEAEEA